MTKDNGKQMVIDNIEMLDFFLSEEDRQLFKNYMQSLDTEKRLEYLYGLRDIYLETKIIEKRVKKDFLKSIYPQIARENNLIGAYKKNKKAFTALLDSYPELKKEVDTITLNYHKTKRFLSEVERLIVLERHIKNHEIPKKYYDDEEADYRDLIPLEENLQQELNLRLREIKYGYYSRKYGIDIDKFIPTPLEKLFAKLETLEDEKRQMVSNLGKDIAKNRLRILKKGKNLYDDAERIFLKNLIMKFSSLEPMKFSQEENHTKNYYDILERLLTTDENYIYIKRMLDNIEGFSNARKKNKELIDTMLKVIQNVTNQRKGGKTEQKERENQLLLDRFEGLKEKDTHILLYLLDQYIYHSKLKLANQNFNFVEPNFYKEIMKLYFKKGIQLTEEEEKLFQTSLDKFATYCRYRNYDSTELLEDIQELKEHGVKQEEERRRETEVSLITKYELPRVVNYYRKENYPYYSKADNQSVFMLNKIPSFAFSISYLEDGSIRFGIHVLDYSKVVEQDSLLAEDLLYDREQLPSMSIGHTYPVMSFSYCIRDYELSPLEISSGVIQLDQMYKEEDLDCYREKEDLKSMFYFLKMFQTGEEVYQQEGMEEIINKKLSQDIKRKFEEEHIPMIYEVNIANKEDLIQRNHNAIVEELGKIPKTEAHQIFDILDQEIDSYYTDDLHQESSVCFDSGSFLGIYLLDTLNKIKNGRYDVEIGYQNNDSYLQKLNEKRDYLPTCFKENGKTYQKEKSI